MSVARVGGAEGEGVVEAFAGGVEGARHPSVGWNCEYADAEDVVEVAAFVGHYEIGFGRFVRVDEVGY